MNDDLCTTERYELALRRIAGSGACRNSTSGPLSCWRDGRDPRSPFGAENVCDACLAWGALHPYDLAKAIAGKS